jgi:hypothetical protein
VAAIRVILTDDHRLIRAGIRALVESLGGRRGRRRGGRRPQGPGGRRGAPARRPPVRHRPALPHRAGVGRRRRPRAGTHPPDESQPERPGDNDRVAALNRDRLVHKGLGGSAMPNQEGPSRLPRRALVAFAARCALRVRPLYRLEDHLSERDKVGTAGRPSHLMMGTLPRRTSARRSGEARNARTTLAGAWPAARRPSQNRRPDGSAARPRTSR